jgi:chloramphenicol 3-O phosphotransferase
MRWPGQPGTGCWYQAIPPDPWFAVGTDMLVDAMPASMHATDAGIEFAAGGGVSVGPEFRALEAVWIEGSPR